MGAGSRTHPHAEADALLRACASLAKRRFLVAEREPGKPFLVVSKDDGSPFSGVAAGWEYTRAFWEFVGFSWSPYVVDRETGRETCRLLFPSTQQEIQMVRVRLAAVWVEAGVPPELARQEADEALIYLMLIEPGCSWGLV